MPITSINQLDLGNTYNYADYMTWRFEQAVELIKGKIFILSPAPASRHQSILTGLAAEILPHFKMRPCKVFMAPFEVRLVKGRKEDKDIFTVVQPDICIICDENKIDERGCLGSPDMIIEILSPATAKKDYNEKFNLYQENGVREYWVVNPDANVIDSYILDDNGIYRQQELFTRNQIVSPSIFPDLSIDLKWVFQ